ncbi:NAD(P)H-dependent D-xylose reductase (XR) [Actinomortierella ambigua]|uniref:NAD(P)H-dependent D-xylose reductase (XR) n=1 Tax=Actinomortierella ambigua TaxID=1343610 RepID=A0A9P6TVF0_9FUNG|nr:NAD(P)H-dependent D-xylose reductase (XR) [Actinomortierella ambigua]
MTYTHSLTLASGSKMPLLGMGVWKVPKNAAADTVYNAIKAGYRLLDCAADYGNEVEVGQGIRQAISEGLVTRADLFVTSKLWNTYHAKEHVPQACRRTLDDLGLDYVDLYLIHFPIALKYVPFEERYPAEWGNFEVDPVPVHETWAAMEELVHKGWAKNIGVSNFSAALLMDVLSYCKIRPAVLHIEVHPYLSNNAMIDYAHKEGLAVQAYSSFGPQSYLEIGVNTGIKSLFEQEVLKKIGERHGKSIAQVILRWLVQKKVAVIPKSNNPVRVVENAQLFDFELTAEEMSDIEKLNKDFRINDPGVYAQIPIFA